VPSLLPSPLASLCLPLYDCSQKDKMKLLTYCNTMWHTLLKSAGWYPCPLKQVYAVACSLAAPTTRSQREKPSCAVMKLMEWYGFRLWFCQA
jgi:hypothetical protein